MKHLICSVLMLSACAGSDPFGYEDESDDYADDSSDYVPPPAPAPARPTTRTTNTTTPNGTNGSSTPRPSTPSTQPPPASNNTPTPPPSSSTPSAPSPPPIVCHRGESCVDVKYSYPTTGLCSGLMAVTVTNNCAETAWISVQATGCSNGSKDGTDTNLERVDPGEKWTCGGGNIYHPTCTAVRYKAAAEDDDPKCYLFP